MSDLGAEAEREGWPTDISYALVGSCTNSSYEDITRAASIARFAADNGLRCQTDLMMTDRQGIEIDFCPQCRGVWLDRGELDKLIERASRYGGDDEEEDRRYRSEHSSEYSRDRYYKKRKSFWTELFD